MSKKIKCDIYTRVSTTMQVDGYSLDAQKEKLKRYAEFQNMEIVNELIALRQHDIAVQRKHPAKFRRFKNINGVNNTIIFGSFVNYIIC